MVGQPVRLTVEVLVTTWLTGAPEFPDLELPGAIVVRPEERALNLTVDFEGARWFGVARSYLIYPQEPREFATPAAEVVVKYGGGTRPSVQLAIPEQALLRHDSGASRGTGLLHSDHRVPHSTKHRA